KAPVAVSLGRRHAAIGMAAVDIAGKQAEIFRPFNTGRAMDLQIGIACLQSPPAAPVLEVGHNDTHGLAGPAGRTVGPVEIIPAAPEAVPVECAGNARVAAVGFGNQ